VLREAVELYHNDRKAWKSLQISAMTADFGWKKSAGEYLEIYRNLTDQ
jgi:starch synthase